jgi:hypothetical protein
MLSLIACRLVSPAQTPSDEGLKNTAPKIEDDPPPEPRIMDLILLVMEHNKRKVGLSRLFSHYGFLLLILLCCD